MASKQYTLMDVYRAAKADRKFDYCFWAEISCGIVAEYVFLQLGRILVMVASVLITTICASGFLIVLPVVAIPNQLWFYFNLIWGKIEKLILDKLFLIRKLLKFPVFNIIEDKYYSFRCILGVQHHIQLHFSCGHRSGETLCS